MAETFKLKGKSFLGGYRNSFGLTELHEVENLEIVSIAHPRDGGTDLSQQVKSEFGIVLPEAGSTTGSIDENGLWFRMSQDQYFAVFPSYSMSAFRRIQQAIGSSGYCTEQTDNWVMMRLIGELARPALERLCPVDIDPSVFPPGSQARTVMAHHAALVYCVEFNHFLLFSVSSSAHCFRHAIETSLWAVSKPLS